MDPSTASDRTSRPTIAAVTPTLCRLFGVAPPALCDAPPLATVLDAAAARLGSRPLDRCLLYAPDAIGEHLEAALPDLFPEVARHAPVRARLRSVLPPKTPVCFASMFTGALPEAHGIRQYERPVLRADTLFDALARAGRRVAIAAVADSSVDRIFRERPLDYFSESYDAEVTARVHALLAEDAHDLIVAYHQEYDDSLHAGTPFSQAALAAARRHAAAFGEQAGAAAQRWDGRAWALLFAPDHGAHLDPATGGGTHGLDIPEDMEVSHFWGLGRLDGSRVGVR